MHDYFRTTSIHSHYHYKKSSEPSDSAQKLVVSRLESVENLTILVTGAAGFIGMHTSIELSRLGARVIAYDSVNSYYDTRLKRARLSKLMAENNSFPILFIHGDVCNSSLLTTTIQDNGVDRVIHLAAQAGVRHSIGHPHDYITNNIDCFVTLLETLKNRNIPLVYASSSSVYGSNHKVPFSECDPVDHPVSLYAASKRSNELAAGVYHHLYNQSSIGLRFFTVYGPWGRPDMAYYMFSHRILNGKPIKLYNHGNQQRDFTYIADIVGGIVSSIRICTSTPEIVNLGNDKPVKLDEFISLIEKHMGKVANLIFVDMQAGDVQRTHANISKARSLLRYTPSTNLDVGLHIFVKWYSWWTKYAKKSGGIRNNHPSGSSMSSSKAEHNYAKF